jgi:hypothetical protein
MIQCVEVLALFEQDAETGMGSHVEDSTQPTCLDEWEKYARLDRKRLFLQRYWYVVAMAPFACVLLIVLRFFPNSSGHFWDTLIFTSLGWALFVAIYAIGVITRFPFIRCPRCDWRFGPGDWCGSCSLPRHSTSPRHGSTAFK